VKLNVSMMEGYEKVAGTVAEYECLLPHPAHREDALCSEEIRLKFDFLNTSKHSSMTH
jgi:hypothetical protein